MAVKMLSKFYSIKKPMLSSFSSSVGMLVGVSIIVWWLLPFFDWAFVKATWVGASHQDCTQGGACWAMIHARFKQFMYGFYPLDQRWRVDVSLGLLAFSLLNLAVLKIRIFYKISIMIILWLGIVYLLHGGFFLIVVPTDKWGGLFLTLVLAVGSIFCAFPLGLLLALGRHSSLGLVKAFSVIFIEIVRGVPLITILFMASVMLPLFFSAEVDIDKLLRAFVGLMLFQAAYLAEVIRGGLNSLPKGQYEASYSLGFGYWYKMRLIILPQALRIVIPGLVNSFIALFKDTTLVLMIGIFDFLGIVQAATTDPAWLGTATESYLFCALVYWIFCFSMSTYSRHLERKLNNKFI